MSVYIEREISASISSESIIDDFKSLGKRKVHLYVCNDQIYILCSLNFE